MRIYDIVFFVINNHFAKLHKNRVILHSQDKEKFCFRAKLAKKCHNTHPHNIQNYPHKLKKTASSIIFPTFFKKNQKFLAKHLHNSKKVSTFASLFEGNTSRERLKETRIFHVP